MHEPTLSNSISPKMLRETLCLAQTALNLMGDHTGQYMTDHVAHLQKLIDEIDVIRPLGPDGKHGDGVRCTLMCGCSGRARLWTLTP